MKRRILITLAVCLMAVLLIAPSCWAKKGTWTVVIVDDVRYKTVFNTADFDHYKGKSLYMPSFVNRATNTRMWYYYSAAGRVTYEGSRPLEHYLWYCFQKAFQQVGMKVYEYNAPKDVPEFRFEFYSFTDEEIVFKVDLLKGGVILFQKPFIAKLLPILNQTDPVQLEMKAYELMDITITTILKDPDFKKAFK